jgi:hypothetical protein
VEVCHSTNGVESGDRDVALTPNPELEPAALVTRRWCSHRRLP